ncbi:NADP-dependent phosphogluconate dehydrogenase [soil metagenome]
MDNQQYDFAMIGLGVMGSNLLQNMAGHGFRVIGYDKDLQKTALLDSLATENVIMKGVNSLDQMIKEMKPPRKIMMLVTAGKPVDSVIEDLLPLIEKGDIIIDGGNSHYIDTLRRINYLRPKGFHFMGMGISGGEKGARVGPSIMPGGDIEAYEHVKLLLEAIAAKVNGEPCTAYMGKDAAGHYVKMVHNGIEYAIMQLISEVYDMLKRGLGLDNTALHDLFFKWNEGELQSYLIEITRDIFLEKDALTGNDLVDMILDKAGSKGTGKWTSQDAMELPVAIPTIDMSVAFRTVSAFKEERIKAAALYKPQINAIEGNKEAIIQQLHDALYFATIICYAQGLAMLYNASTALQMEIPLKDVVKSWRGGCIIRSALLETFYTAFTKNDEALSNILLDEDIAGLIKKKEENIRKIIALAAQNKISAAGLMSALAYFDAYTTERMPTNLIQAQRDYFGAHTYQRIDKEGSFHTEWEGLEKKSV